MIVFMQRTLILAGVVGAAMFGPRVWQADVSTQPPKPSAQPQIGSVRCSGCHQEHDEKYLTQAPGADCWRGSATIWHARDPHKHAYAALTSELGRTMSRLLKIDATTDARCLACHTNPSLAAANLSPAQMALRGEGVSCEACHGDAEGWIASHTVNRLARPAGAWPQPGFRDLNDLHIRAETCAGCHVGGPGKDMNHDMIAAGHPRLEFDFASHLARLPQHWHERDRMKPSDGPANSPQRLIAIWTAGNRATGEARRQLLASRATDSSKPWPEFAEYSCVSCHRSLSGAASAGKVALRSTPTWSALPVDGLAPLAAAMNQSIAPARDTIATLAASPLKHHDESLPARIAYWGKAQMLTWDEATAAFHDLAFAAALAPGDYPEFDKLREMLRSPIPPGQSSRFDGEEAAKLVAALAQRIVLPP